MRIGMILDQQFPPDPRVENEAIALINAGHEVFLFCLDFSGSSKNEVYKGVQVRRYASNSFQYKLSALAYDFPLYFFFMKKRIKHFIESTKVEVLHIHDMRIAGAVFDLNKKFKLPVVLDLHDNLPENMKFYPHLNSFPGKFIISPKRWKQKEEEFINRSDKVITVSPEFVEEIIERTKVSSDKMVLVPNSVSESFYNDHSLEKDIINRYKDNFVLLYVGDTNLRRGLLTAIRSLPFLIHEIPHLKLVIVGKNTTDSILKEEVNKLGLEAYVDFEGWQDLSLFPSYIFASDLCLSPLNRSIQHDVAYANKIFQYMSYGKPIIVSDALAQKRIVEKWQTGLVHKEKDPKDLSNKILKLYTDKNLAVSLGKNGKDFIVNEFRWELTSRELIRLYENI